MRVGLSAQAAFVSLCQLLEKRGRLFRPPADSERCNDYCFRRRFAASDHQAGFVEELIGKGVVHAVYEVHHSRPAAGHRLQLVGDDDRDYSRLLPGEAGVGVAYAYGLGRFDVECGEPNRRSVGLRDQGVEKGAMRRVQVQKLEVVDPPGREWRSEIARSWGHAFCLDYDLDAVYVSAAIAVEGAGDRVEVRITVEVPDRIQRVEIPDDGARVVLARPSDGARCERGAIRERVVKHRPTFGPVKSRLMHIASLPRRPAGNAGCEETRQHLEKVRRV